MEKGKATPPAREEVEVQTNVSLPFDLGISYVGALRKKTTTLQLVPTHKREKIKLRKSTNKRQNKLSPGYSEVTCCCLSVSYVRQLHMESQ